jgi:hypothetical protein
VNDEFRSSLRLCERGKLEPESEVPVSRL